MVRPAYGRFSDTTNTPTEILASTDGLEKLGIMIDTADTTAPIVKGTIMGKITASGLYVPYDDDGTDDGRRVALGVLADNFDPTVSADQADLRLAANMYIHGSFVEANLTGLDTAGKTDLFGRTVGSVFTF